MSKSPPTFLPVLLFRITTPSIWSPRLAGPSRSEKCAHAMDCEGIGWRVEEDAQCYLLTNGTWNYKWPKDGAPYARAIKDIPVVPGAPWESPEHFLAELALILAPRIAEIVDTHNPGAPQLVCATTAPPFTFPWRPGMALTAERHDLGTVTGRVLGVRPSGQLEIYYRTQWFVGETAITADLCHPDRTDPATLGALLGVVREVYSAPHAYLWPNRGASEWAVYQETTFSQREPLGEGATEFDALIAAYKATGTSATAFTRGSQAEVGP